MVVRDSSGNIVKDDSKRGRLAYKPDGSVEVMMSCGEVRVFDRLSGLTSWIIWTCTKSRAWVWKNLSRTLLRAFAVAVNLL
jgi:hypothetical protein